MDVTVACSERRELACESTAEASRKPSVFSMALFSEYQNRISSYLLCRRRPLKQGPLPVGEDSAALVLTGRDSVLIGPTAFLCFILIEELESLDAAPALSAVNISFLLNRHGRAGLPLVERVLDLGVEQGLLQSDSTSISLGEVFGCSNNLQRILADCNRNQSSAASVDRAHSTERQHDAMSESDVLGQQIKRAYLAHKNGQVDYVLESTAFALKALRSKELSSHQTILDQKVLLLSSRARALMQAGQLNASDACLHAVIKCMAVSAKRHSLPT